MDGPESFAYQPLFSITPEKDVAFRLLTADGVHLECCQGRDILQIAPQTLTRLAAEAMRDVNYLLRPAHQEQVAAILNAPEASDNERFVARSLLKNALIAAQKRLPFCQDTGTAIVMARKGEQVWTGGSDAEALSKGIFQAYTREAFRYSQVAPLSMYEEKNTGCNLPAQIEISAIAGSAYHFLFIAKGGGSANKTQLFQMTRALLHPDRLIPFLTRKIREIGTAACPPYHLAVVIGGLSAELNLKTVKLASTGYLDTLPTDGNEKGRAFRDQEMEKVLLRITRDLGIGAQFGGKFFCHDIRVIRLPRHGASCPVGLGVSCSADRNILARIDRNGVWLEQLELDPARFLSAEEHSKPGIPVNLNRPMAEIQAQLHALPVRTRLSLNGKMIVARDMAHARIAEMLKNGDPMPEWFQRHPVYYAGPAKTPEGAVTGSLGPTTAQRMDPYVETFQKKGGSLIMVAKGNRGKEVVEACRRNGGFYLSAIGGPAALLAHDCMQNLKLLAFPEFGMEAVWEIEVKDFPAFLLIDDKGNDFFQSL